MLKTDIVNESKTVKMIGRFKTCKATDTVNMYDTKVWATSALVELLTHVSECMKDHYELNCEKVSEAVVFRAADLDRRWERNTIRCGLVSKG